MVTFKLDTNAKVTEKELAMLADAAKMPALYDDDSPEMTEKMEKAFREARQSNPFKGEAITLFLSKSTMAKAKALGPNYVDTLEKLLDRALDEYIAQ